MVKLPPWLVFFVAFWVVVFGVFRIYIAHTKLRDEAKDKPPIRRGGLYAQSRRRHIVFGIAYLALGGVLIAMGLGIKLPGFGSDDATTATKPEATSIEAKPIK